MEKKKKWRKKKKKKPLHIVTATGHSRIIMQGLL